MVTKRDVGGGGGQPLEKAQIKLENIKGEEDTTDHLANAPWLHGKEGTASSPAFGAGWPDWTE